MSDQGATGAPWSNSESEPFRLNSTSLEDKLIAEHADLSVNQNVLYHQSQ